MSNPRRAAGLGAAVLIALGGVLSTAASCSTSTCVNSSCTVTFKGGTGSTRLDSIDASVRVDGVQDDRAVIAVDGIRGVIAAGETRQVGSYRVTAEKVTSAEVRLKIQD